MIKYLYLFLLCICLVNCTNSEESEKVTETFNSYKKALLDNDIPKAISLVDTNTLEHYEALLKKVQQGDSLSLMGLDPMEKYVLLAVRQNATKEQILSFTSSSFLSYLISEGLEGKSRVTNNRMGQVKVSSKTAIAQLIAGNKITKLNWSFTKEGELWKINLVSLMPTASEQFKKMIVNSQKDVNEFIFGLLEKRTGERPDASIWVPVKR